MEISEKARKAIQNMLKDDMVLRLSMEDSVCCRRPVAWLDVKRDNDSVVMVEGIPVVFELDALDSSNQIVMDLQNGAVVTTLKM